MQMHVCSASLSRIYLAYKEFKHACSCRHALQISVQLRPSVETPPLASVSARIHFKIALLTFKSLHTIAPSYLSSSFNPMFLRAPSALPVLSVSVSHASAPFSALGVSDRPVLQFGIPCHFQFLPAPPFILSRNSSRLICLPQPSPLVELSSMRLWFDDLHLFIYLVVFDFVRA